MQLEEEQDIDDEDDEDDFEDKIDKNAKDFIAAQYEKVHRTKAKYKCIFKDVVIHMNGKDYVVKKINADIEY